MRRQAVREGERHAAALLADSRPVLDQSQHGWGSAPIAFPAVGFRHVADLYGFLSLVTSVICVSSACRYSPAGAGLSRRRRPVRPPLHTLVMLVMSRRYSLFLRSVGPRRTSFADSIELPMASNRMRGNSFSNEPN